MEANNNSRLVREDPYDVSNYHSIIKRRAEVVRIFRLFADISPEDCAKIVATAQHRSYPSGKTIFFEGDAVRQVMLLTSGCVKLSQTGSQGQEVILRLIGSGDTLCAECFPTYTHCSTAQTMQPSSALVWDSHQFEAMANRVPILGRNIACTLLRTLNQLEVRFREICTEKVASRLSSELLRLVNQVGQRSNGHVEIAISQKDLAQLVGTTLFTVSRVLGQWESQGIVKPQRQGVLVLDIAALESVSQSE